MHVRVPKKLVQQMRSDIKAPVSVAKVRDYLREKKLYHYYTSSNNLARTLGDPTSRIRLNTRAFDVMCDEANAVSACFDQMRHEGLIQRKNFVNANVLIWYIATNKFSLPEIKKHLRLPRAATIKKHKAILEQVYARMNHQQ